MTKTVIDHIAEKFNSFDGRFGTEKAIDRTWKECSSMWSDDPEALDRLTIYLALEAADALLVHHDLIQRAIDLMQSSKVFKADDLQRLLVAKSRADLYPPLKNMVKLCAGLIFRVPLTPMISVYGRVVHRDEDGEFVEFYEVTQSSQAPPEEVVRRSVILGPLLISNLASVLREGLWQQTGQVPVMRFEYPLLKSAIKLADGSTSWFLVRGSERKFIGSTLPPQFKDLDEAGYHSAAGIESNLKLLILGRALTKFEQYF